MEEKAVGADRRGFQAEECEKRLSQTTDPGEGKRERMDFLESTGQLSSAVSNMACGLLGLYILGTSHLQQITERLAIDQTPSKDYLP